MVSKRSIMCPASRKKRLVCRERTIQKCNAMSESRAEKCGRRVRRACHCGTLEKCAHRHIGPVTMFGIGCWPRFAPAATFTCSHVHVQTSQRQDTMRLAAYAGTSALVAAGALLKAFHQRPNFYSATVYLSQSNACVLVSCCFCYAL